MSLYRNYRPQTFADMVGQAHVVQTMCNALGSDHVNHAYLFTGPRGTGKTSTARLLAKALNCEQKDGIEPCNECETCQAIGSGSLLDVIEIDAASNRGIDEMRELRDTIRFQPTVGHVKVYIIDEVHMLTKEAFNALLKTLEEPPDYAYFILATTEIDKIPDTIVSRCQRFDFYRLELMEIVDRLQHVCEAEGIKAGREALELIAKESHGGLRDALGFLEQLSSMADELKVEAVRDFLGYTDYALCEKFANALVTGDAVQAVQIVQDLEHKGSQFDRFYEQILTILREQFLTKLRAEENINWYIRAFRVLEEQYQLFKTSEYPQLALEVSAGLLSEFGQRPVKQTTAEVKPEVKVEPVVEEVEEKAKAEEPPPAATVEKVEQKTPQPNKGKISLNLLRTDWPKVVERVPSTALRLSLKQAIVQDLAGDEVKLAFTSSFHQQQVESAQNLAATKQALNKYFDHKFELILANNIVDPEQAPANNEASDFVDSTMDLFADM